MYIQHSPEQAGSPPASWMRNSVFQVLILNHSAYVLKTNNILVLKKHFPLLYEICTAVIMGYYIRHGD